MTAEWSDAQVMAGVARGDARAMRELIDRHGDYLYGVARALTNSPADAEDAVQETLTALLTAKFRGDAKLRTFLVSIVVRQAALIRRKKRPMMRLADDGEYAGEGGQSAGRREDGSGGLARTIVARTPRGARAAGVGRPQLRGNGPNAGRAAGNDRKPLAPCP